MPVRPTRPACLAFACSLAATVAMNAAQAQAQQFTIDINFPSLQVAEYHRPYIAFWTAAGDSDAYLPVGAESLEVWLCGLPL